jgi:hypothetical protein
LAQLARFRTNQRDCYWIGGLKEVECPCKAKQAVVIRGMLLLLVRGCGRAAVGLMQTQPGKGNIVESGSLGELSTGNRKQQRLHDQRVNRGRGDQPPPVGECRSDLISRSSHAHELISAAAWSHRKPVNRKGVEPTVSIVGTMGVATPIACCHGGGRDRKIIVWQE